MKLPLVVSFFCTMFASEHDKTLENYERVILRIMWQYSITIHMLHIIQTK